MAALHLKDLRKVYPNGFEAVRGVDLEIHDGEFMVFVGPSGCAKSTLLRMVAGLESISAGELRIGERVVNGLPPKQRGIAMVFQNYALYPHMKVFDNLAFGLELAHTPKDEVKRRVHEAAELLEMTHLLDRYPKQLSGGQAQRVAVGRAIVKRPEVFLFDEPLSNLDAKLRASMRVRLTELHRTLREQGRPATVIYVTHDQTEAMTMGERICVLKEGRIQQVDRPTALYEKPANAFVAGFIGSPEMNLQPAELRGGQLRLGDVGVALDTRIEGAVQFGLRPEHISALPRPGSVPVTGTVRSLEHMGNEVFVHFGLGDRVFTARIAADALDDLPSKQRGDRHVFYLQLAHAHLFDAEGAKRLQ